MQDSVAGTTYGALRGDFVAVTTTSKILKCRFCGRCNTAYSQTLFFFALCHKATSDSKNIAAPPSSTAKNKNDHPARSSRISQALFENTGRLCADHHQLQRHFNSKDEVQRATGRKNHINESDMSPEKTVFVFLKGKANAKSS